MEPKIPLMGVDVGVWGGELAPSNQVSLLKICRLAPESKTQRDNEELSVRNLIALTCVRRLYHPYRTLRTSQSCFVGCPSAHRIPCRSIPLHTLGRARVQKGVDYAKEIQYIIDNNKACDRIPAIICVSGLDR